MSSHSFGSSLGTGLALYDFSAVEEGELSVAKGDRVSVVRPPQDDWVMVQFCTDAHKKGFVPEGVRLDHILAFLLPPCSGPTL